MEFIVRNFKSIKETKLDLARINVLIGPPNSGKSNLLEAIYLYGIKKGMSYGLIVEFHIV